MSGLTPRDTEQLLELFERGDWRELRLSSADARLLLSKDPAARLAGPGGATAVAARALPDRPVVAAASDAAADPATGVAVRAPCLGTFYRAPKPGAPPYVEVGQRVSADTEVCIVEVMKLFTAVRAGLAGVVRAVAVQDAELVELGQPLLWIEPDA